MPNIIAYKARWETVERVPKGSQEAPEEVIEDIPVNLTPFFSHDFSDVYDATSNPGAYWRILNTARIPDQLDDGWARAVLSNASTTGSLFANFYIAKSGIVVPGETYTLLVEWRNNTFANNKVGFTPSANAAAQMQGPTAYLNGESGSMVRTMVAKDNAQDSSMTILVRTYLYAVRTADPETPTAGSVELRVSLYEGEYDGAYVPFVQSRVDSLVGEGE